MHLSAKNGFVVKLLSLFVFFVVLIPFFFSAKNRRHQRLTSLSKNREEVWFTL